MKGNTTQGGALMMGQQHLVYVVVAGNTDLVELVRVLHSFLLRQCYALVKPPWKSWGTDKEQKSICVHFVEI